jgi:hypothetical protein
LIQDLLFNVFILILFTEEFCFISQQGPEIYVFFETFRPTLGLIQRPVLCTPWASCPGAKRRVCETDRSPASNTGDEKEWSWVSTFPYAYVACAGNNFIIT